MILDKLKEARDFLENKGIQKPEVAIILGSGLGSFGDTIQNPVIVPYEEIPHFAASKVKGHKGRLIFGEVESLPILCQQGRFHYYEGHPMEKVVFPARLMAFMGAKTAIVTNAAGAVNPALQPGDLMLIKDHINFMGTNPLIGPNEEALGPRFPDMTEAYSQRLRDYAKKQARLLSINIREGVYLACSGPSYETPAEIRAFRLLGADAVGMSTVPEVLVFRQMGVKVLGISCITNMAAGILPTPLSHEEVIEVGKQVETTFATLLKSILARLSQR